MSYTWEANGEGDKYIVRLIVEPGEHIEYVLQPNALDGTAHRRTYAYTPFQTGGVGMKNSSAEGGWIQGFTNRSVLPDQGGDDAQGHSAAWWNEHRRGSDMRRAVERAAAPAIHRAYVRLGFILSALAKLLTAEEVEAA